MPCASVLQWRHSIPFSPARPIIPLLPSLFFPSWRSFHLGVILWPPFSHPHDHDQRRRRRRHHTGGLDMLSRVQSGHGPRSNEQTEVLSACRIVTNALTSEAVLENVVQSYILIHTGYSMCFVRPCSGALGSHHLADQLDKMISLIHKTVDPSYPG